MAKQSLHMNQSICTDKIISTQRAHIIRYLNLKKRRMICEDTDKTKICASGWNDRICTGNMQCESLDEGLYTRHWNF